MEDQIIDFAPAEQQEQPPLKVDHSDPVGVEETEAEPSALESDDDLAGLEDPLIGQIVAQTFELQRCLGRGGMGVVYQARHIIIDKPVALKLLNQLKAKEPEVLARFRREAVAISSLDHPNIVRLNAFGVDEQDRAYLVMDLVEGKPLSDLIKERGRLAPKQALEITSQILAALSHSHGKHMIHRDIKPGNIMVVEVTDGSLSVKVVDFGLAKIVGSSESLSQSLSLTKTGEMLGSPHYMSPEQCRGEPLAEQSDIYSTGCVLYEMLSGRPPFDADNMLKVLHLHATSRHKPLPDLKVSQELMQSLNGLVDTAMAKDLADRYSSAGAMQKSLQSIMKRDWSCEELATEIAAGSYCTNSDAKGSQPFFVKSGIYMHKDPDERARSHERQEKERLSNKQTRELTGALAGHQGDKAKEGKLLHPGLILISTTIAAMVALTLVDFIKLATHPTPQGTPGVSSARAPAVGNSMDEYTNMTFDLENLSVLDPSTGRTFNFTEKQDSRQQKIDFLPDNKAISYYTREDSTIDGGIPTLFPSYQSFKQKMKEFANLNGRSYADLDHRPILEAADYCYDCGDMARALCFYQKLLAYGHLDSSEKATLRAKVGDCYVYFNNFDTAAQSYLAALGYQKASETNEDKDQSSILELKLAYCYTADSGAPARDYAQKSFETMSQLEPLAPNSSLRKNTQNQTVLGDANLMLNKPTEALLNFQSARWEVMAIANRSLKDIHKRYVSLLDLRIAKACLALERPDDALKALHTAMNNIESITETPAPSNEPTMRRELLPRIYYSIGLAYEQKYKLAYKTDINTDTKPLNLALENFYAALKTSMDANSDAQNSAFAEMCLAKLSLLSPDFIVTYPDGKHRAAAEHTRVAALKQYRPILPPTMLQE